jgi:hypothetical protein
MTEAELKRQHWQYVQPVGIIRDHAPVLYTRGICGGESFCIAITVNGNTFNRLAGESWDALLTRVRTDLTARGDPSNIATCAYDPPVQPQEVHSVQPRFRQPMHGG